MSDVYLGKDLKNNKKVAVKILHESHADNRNFTARFKREAENLARLGHPNIIRLYGLEQEGFQAFMLMDYVDGDNLKKEIFRYQGKGMPPGRIREVITPICSALGYAHNLGLVHCDLKPANIMIDRTGKVFLADFGIARLTDAATATLIGAVTIFFLIFAKSYGLNLINGIAIGLFFISALPIMLTMSAEMNGPEFAGISVGYLQLLGNAAAVLLVWLIEALRAATGAFTAPLSMLVVLLFGAFVISIFIKDTSP